MKHTRNNNETTSPFFIFVVKVRFPFLRVRVCVHFRVSNYVSFFFKREVLFAFIFEVKKKDEKTLVCTHTLKHHHHLPLAQRKT